MEAILINDDDRCRQADGLISDFSSELCATAFSDLESLLKTTLPRITEAAGADSTMLVSYGQSDADTRACRYASASADHEVDHSTFTQDGGSPWNHLDLDGEPLVLDRIPGDLPSGAVTPELVEHLRQTPLHSAVVIPVAIGGERMCMVAFEAHQHRSWSRQLVKRLRLFSEILAGGLHRRQQALAIESSGETRHVSPTDGHDSASSELDVPADRAEAIGFTQ